MNCPKCDQEMEHIEAEPDVGLMSGGWYCHGCGHDVADFDTPDDEPDVRLCGIAQIVKTKVFGPKQRLTEVQFSPAFRPFVSVCTHRVSP